MTKTISKNVLLGLFLLFVSNKAFSHCQVPCGIYEDSLRIELINEHIKTIEKAMNQINELSLDGDKNYNQIVRWVNNKEIHATKIQTIVSEYFLHQRIKPVEKSNHHYAMYVHNLESLHHISVYAMKAKQTTDLSSVDRLRELVQQFSDNYFHEHQH
jgi:nickel superoxide dismutase